MYDRGDIEGVARAIEQVTEARSLDRLDSDLRDRARPWIESAPPEQRMRRTYVAATVALEVTHALTAHESWRTDRAGSHSVNPEALPEVARMIARASSRPEHIDHDWVLAALATWEEWDSPARMLGTDSWVTPEPGWAVLLGQPRLVDHLKVQSAVGDGGFLGQSLRRFPADPRLLLAKIEGYEAIETRCADQFCHDEMTPTALDDLRKRAKEGAPTDEGVGCRDRCWVFALMRHLHDSAVANLAAFDRLPAVATQFTGLANGYPTVRAEADVHTGYLAIRAGRPDAALAPLVTATTSEDPYVRYLAEHFRGRALEMMGRRDEAIAAYRRGLAIVPDAPSTATLLASQLSRSNDAADRAEAHRVLEASRVASPRPVDPWDLYWQGDARLRTVYVERLQQDLRQ